MGPSLVEMCKGREAEAATDVEEDLDEGPLNMIMTTYSCHYGTDSTSQSNQ